MSKQKIWDAIIVGGGIAGLSAAIYLGRAQRSTLVIDSGKSMAQWEPDVQNYLGFPKGISGVELLKRGEQQARRYGGATAAQSINRDLFAESLASHSLRHAFQGTSKA